MQIRLNCCGKYSVLCYVLVMLNAPYKCMHLHTNYQVKIHKCLQVMCLSLSHCLFTVSELGYSLGQHAVFWVDMQFFVADMQLFCSRYAVFFAVVLSIIDLESVYHVTGHMVQCKKKCISATKSCISTTEIAYPSKNCISDENSYDKPNSESDSNTFSTTSQNMLDSKNDTNEWHSV